MEETLKLLSFGPDGWGDQIASGVGVTIGLALATLPLGLVAGFLIALAKQSEEGPLRLAAETDSRVMIIGGAPLGERHIWWNFVSSSRERIEQAKDQWREGRFGKVPGDDEFIPLPDR